MRTDLRPARKGSSVERGAHGVKTFGEELHHEFSRRTLDDRLVDARAALAALQDAYGVARKRYDGGLSTYLDVLNVEDQLLAARQTLAGLEANAFSTDIALIRALGGGFAAGATLSKDRPHG